MDEREPGAAGTPEITITHDEVILNPDLWPQYRDERVAYIKTGQPTWMLRGVVAGDMDPGIVMDYYHSGGLRGFLEGADVEGYTIYVPGGDTEGQRCLNEEPVLDLNQAQRVLEDYIKDRYGQPEK